MRLENCEFPVQLGGHLCLNFTNTAEFRHTDHRLEFLHSYEHVLAWCWQNHLITEKAAERIGALATQRPAEAEAAFQQALELREMFYCIFTAAIANEFPGSGNLALLNQTLSRTQQQRGISISDNADYGWAWTYTDDLASVLAPLVFSGADLLASDQLGWVRQCPNCGWLFLDTSRNHTRRWCSMDYCGSKVKSHRQYERRKQNQA